MNIRFFQRSDVRWPFRTLIDAKREELHLSVAKLCKKSGLTSARFQSVRRLGPVVVKSEAFEKDVTALCVALGIDINDIENLLIPHMPKDKVQEFETVVLLNRVEDLLAQGKLSLKDLTAFLDSAESGQVRNPASEFMSGAAIALAGM